MARFQRQTRLIALAACLSPGLAHAQVNQQVPQIVTLPGAEHYSLPPSPSAQTPPPAAVPVPAPTPAPSPALAPEPVAAAPKQPPTRHIDSPPHPSAPAARASSASPPMPRAPQVVSAPRSPAPPAIVPLPRRPAPAAAPPPTQGAGAPSAFWLIGILILAVTGALALIGYRRRKPGEAARAEAEPRATAPPVTTVGRGRILVPPRTGLEIALQPLRLGLGEHDALLDYELVVTNHGPTAMDDIKVVLGIISAQPAQDQVIASFHSGAALAAGVPAFTLAAGASQRLPGRLTLRRESILPVTVGGRPMIVPIALIHLRWRQGLGIRSHGEAHMVGPEGEEGKPRPIWLDRGPRMFGGLVARRYAPEPLAQALAG